MIFLIGRFFNFILFFRFSKELKRPQNHYASSATEKIIPSLKYTRLHYSKHMYFFIFHYVSVFISRGLKSFVSNVTIIVKIKNLSYTQDNRLSDLLCRNTQVFEYKEQFIHHVSSMYLPRRYQVPIKSKSEDRSLSRYQDYVL